MKSAVTMRSCWAQLATPASPGVLERGLLLKMRFELDHALNLRPVKLPAGIESPIAAGTPRRLTWSCVEGTEGLYCGAGGFLRKDTVHEVATEESINTWYGVERLVRAAFRRAQARPRKEVDPCAQDECPCARKQPLPAGGESRRRRVR